MDTVSVKNRSSSTVVYSLPEQGIRRQFTPGEVKTIDVKELEALTYRPGGLTLINDCLMIQDQGIARQILNKKVEPEYWLDEKGVTELLLHGSYDSFLDCLDFAPPGVIDLIKKLSVSLPLSDIQKRNALKAKTGFDCDAALKHVMEEKEDDGENTILKTSGERRVKKEETPTTPERRTAPKYNVVSKDKEAATE